MVGPVQRQMARGALWMVLFKLLERSLGLISTLILVRLLSPSDFGIVAMALSFVVMAELLSAFGFDIALIQNQAATEDHYHAAWTGNLILGCAITAAMLALALPIAHFYRQQELFWVVVALAFGPLFTGCENIGVVAFRKDLRFKREFAFQLSRKLIGFFVTIPLAFALRNYWALVAGILASKLSGTLISYLAHPFRPRLSLAAGASLFHLSKWLLINNIVAFFKDRAPDFFLGRMQGPSALGLFNVSYEFSNLPTTELSAPINRALLPGFAKIEDRREVSAAYSNTMGLLALLALPAAAGIFAVAPLLTPVVLGAKWLAATELMQILAFHGAAMLFHSSISSVLIARGHPGAVVFCGMVYIVILVGGLAAMTGPLGSTGAAYAVLLASLLCTPVYLAQLKRRIGVGVMVFIRSVVRPALASAAMVIAVRALAPTYDPGWGSLHALGLLLLLIAAGVATYASFLIVLWLVRGRPAGAEKLVLDRVMATLARRG